MTNSHVHPVFSGMLNDFARLSAESPESAMARVDYAEWPLVEGYGIPCNVAAFDEAGVCIAGLLVSPATHSEIESAARDMRTDRPEAALILTKQGNTIRE